MFKVNLGLIWEVNWDWSSWGRERPHEVRMGGVMRIDVFHTFWANPRPRTSLFSVSLTSEGLRMVRFDRKVGKTLMRMTPPAHAHLAWASHGGAWRETCVHVLAWIRSKMYGKRRCARAPPCAFSGPHIESTWRTSKNINYLRYKKHYFKLFKYIL